MRVLLVSDLHYSAAKFDWLLHAASRIDALVISGDLLDLTATAALDTQVTVVSERLQQIATTTQLFVASGNHDLIGSDANGEKRAAWLQDLRSDSLHVDGDTVETGDTEITVCPSWDGPIGREVLADRLERESGDRPRWWVWAYHWAPEGSPTSWTGTSSFGDPHLKGWIDRYQPDLVLTGHVHQAPFRSGGSWFDQIGRTWVFNPGNEMGAIPSSILLDLGDQPTATWTSSAGTESVDLTSAGGRDTTGP